MWIKRSTFEAMQRQCRPAPGASEAVRETALRVVSMLGKVMADSSERKQREVRAADAITAILHHFGLRLVIDCAHGGQVGPVRAERIEINDVPLKKKARR